MIIENGKRINCFCWRLQERWREISLGKSEIHLPIWFPSWGHWTVQSLSCRNEYYKLHTHEVYKKKKKACILKIQNVSKHWMCICTNYTHTHTHIGVVTSYQATVISPLISVQIKARSVAAELCWLITGSCKGFRSLSMASGPHPHSRGSCDQGHGRPDRHGDEAYDYKHSASICSPWLIGLGAARLQRFPAEEASASLILMFCGPSLKNLFFIRGGFSTGISAVSTAALALSKINDLKVCNRFDKLTLSLGGFSLGLCILSNHKQSAV